MIVISLLLIATATLLLVSGLWQSSSGMLSGSIGASLLAAIVLVVGTRRGAGRVSVATPAEPARRQPPEPETPQPRLARARITIPAQHRTGHGGAHAAGPQQREQVTMGTSVSGQLTDAGYPPTGGPPAGDAGYLATDRQPPADPSEQDGEQFDPPDEPAPQQVSPADAARVGRMLAEVLVVDGRPRYHLPGCVRLLGRGSEPLPVAEAVELGFTPCGLCEPDSALLADARRV